MKSLLFLLVAALPVTSALATFDMQCGPKGHERYEVELHIEDDGSNPPQHWDMRVNGKRPFTLSPARIKVSGSSVTVTLNQGGDSVWSDYVFDTRGECDSETYDQKVSIYQRTISEKQFLKTIRCKCIED